MQPFSEATLWTELNTQSRVACTRSADVATDAPGVCAPAARCGRRVRDDRPSAVATRDATAACAVAAPAVRAPRRGPHRRRKLFPAFLPRRVCLASIEAPPCTSVLRAEHPRFLVHRLAQRAASSSTPLSVLPSHFLRTTTCWKRLAGTSSSLATSSSWPTSGLLPSSGQQGMLPARPPPPPLGSRSARDLFSLSCGDPSQLRLPCREQGHDVCSAAARLRERGDSEAF